MKFDDLRYESFSEMEAAAFDEAGDSEAAFAAFKNGFTRLNSEQRQGVLDRWKPLFAEEIKPTRLLGDFVSRHRELRALDNLLKRAGR